MGTGKKKIEIKKITKPTYRMVTFSKRRKGLFKKSQKLESLTDSRVVSVVFSPTGKLYTYGDVDYAIEKYYSGNSSTSAAVPSIPVLDYMDYYSCSEVPSTSSPMTPRRDGFRDWVESIDVDECENLNRLLMLKEQLEGSIEKIVSNEDSESFEALFA
ncbi:MADS-box transcription factor 21-like [Capsicum galapagoense]